MTTRPKNKIRNYLIIHFLVHLFDGEILSKFYVKGGENELYVVREEVKKTANSNQT